MPQKLSKAAQVLLGESANQGPDGMAMVADIMFNRAHRTGKTMDDVAMAPKQFSAASRKDLASFVAQQPSDVQAMAQRMIAERQVPDYVSQYPGVEHYVTRELFDRRMNSDVPSWIRQMEPVYQVGSHVLLKPKKGSVAVRKQGASLGPPDQSRVQGDRVDPAPFTYADPARDLKFRSTVPLNRAIGGIVTPDTRPENAVGAASMNPVLDDQALLRALIFQRTHGEA